MRASNVEAALPNSLRSRRGAARAAHRWPSDRRVRLERSFKELFAKPTRPCETHENRENTLCGHKLVRSEVAMAQADMQDEILTEIQDNGVATITLNRPTKVNSFAPDTWTRLIKLFRDYDLDPAVRVVVLTGAGGNFSSGANLKRSPDAQAERSIDATREGWYTGLTLTKTITGMNKPVIALVEGWAVAGGFALAVSCDLVYASETATFWPNFLRLGFPPELGTLLFVPSMVGPYKAKEIFLTSRKISAHEALALGMVCNVFPSETIHQEVHAVADEIASCATASVSMTKRFINNTVFDHMDLVLSAELQNTPYVTQSEESNRLRTNNFLRKD